VQTVQRNVETGEISIEDLSIDTSPAIDCLKAILALRNVLHIEGSHLSELTISGANIDGSKRNRVRKVRTLKPTKSHMLKACLLTGIAERSLKALLATGKASSSKRMNIGRQSGSH
jgi:hypothetical protein